MAGMYDSVMSYGELRRYGDFGLGTFAGLDGEMVALDGEFYQVRADGRAYPVPDEAGTPFAAVTFFSPDTVFRAGPAMDFPALSAYLDRLRGPAAPPLAIRVEGRFTAMRTRSVPRQEKPYRPFAEVTATQPTFDLGAVEGTMIGFRFPAGMSALNAEGYHFHFITADRRAGGHVLSFALASGSVSLAELPEFLMRLPRESEFRRVGPDSLPPGASADRG